MTSGPNVHSSLDRLLRDTLDRLARVERRIAINGTGGSAASVPGVMEAFAGGTPPDNWLICDGSAVSRQSYAELFDAIGTTYGSGDGTLTFNIPDARGRVLVGRHSGQTEFDVLGETGGARTHTLTTAEMPSHEHDFEGQTIFWGTAGTVHFDNVQAIAGPASANGMYTVQGGDGWTNTFDTGGGGAHNNLQPYLVTNWIIYAGTIQPLGAYPSVPFPSQTPVAYPGYTG